MKKIERVLFICYANLCRSPAAHKLAEHYAEKNNLKGVVFDSAGWHIAYPTAQPETKEYIKEKIGVDMTDFKSKLITKEMIEKQDLIIGMESYHLVKVRNLFKEIKHELKEKMFTLKEFNGASKDDLNIPDPFNTGLENYNRIIGIVDENVEKLVQKICEINNSAS